LLGSCTLSLPILGGCVLAVGLTTYISNKLKHKETTHQKEALPMENKMKRASKEIVSSATQATAKIIEGVAIGCLT